MTSPEETTNVDLTSPPPTIDPADAFWNENKMLIFYVVLPIFLFCFCGSCIYYAAYKIYEGCGRTVPRRKRQKSRTKLVRSFADTQTKSHPITPRDVGVNDEKETLVPPPIARTENETAELQKGNASDNTAFDLKEDEDDIDFTKLSLSEILYIREMLGEIAQKRSKKKKVLSA